MKRFLTIEDVLEELRTLSESDENTVEGVILLAKVCSDDSDTYYCGFTPDITEDPVSALGQIEVFKSRLYQLILAGRSEGKLH